jgi:hypothetical protein
MSGAKTAQIITNAKMVMGIQGNRSSLMRRRVVMVRAAAEVSAAKLGRVVAMKTSS